MRSSVLMLGLFLPVLAAQDGYGPHGPGLAALCDRLCVKVIAEVDVECENGVLRSRTGHDLEQLTALLEGCRLEPAVATVPRRLLDEWHARAQQGPPQRRPGHLGHWLYVTTRDAEHAERLLPRLAAEPLVEHAYRAPVFELPGAAQGNDPPPPTPSFRHLQFYLDASPTGLGVRRAQGVLGARGQRLQVRMVELDWILDHEDIGQLVAGNFLGGLPLQDLGRANHGLAGSSLLVADRNEWGLTGIVDEARIRFVPIEGNGVPGALLLAAADCQPGDVLMMVIQLRLGQLGSDDWVPIEYLQLEFDAVATVTGNGRIVVSSAANGYRSLDDPRHLRRFDRSFRDSGAILVAATDGDRLARASFSNYGSRVDANGWGENVVSAGYGTLFYGANDPRQAYTAGYSGTSAATPLLCGVVAALQSAARQQLARDLSAAEIVALLQQHGTQIPGSIGRRPDLLAMFRAASILDGLLPDEPDVVLGGSVAVQIEGTGNGAFLFNSLGVADIALGYNRALHLDPATLVAVGYLPFAAGRASWTLHVPNDPVLHGTNLYLQAAVLQTGGEVHVTNSAQISVL